MTLPPLGQTCRVRNSVAVRFGRTLAVEYHRDLQVAAQHMKRLTETLQAQQRVPKHGFIETAVQHLQSNWQGTHGTDASAGVGGARPAREAAAEGGSTSRRRPSSDWQASTRLKLASVQLVRICR